jgi:hypothetical protein
MPYISAILGAVSQASVISDLTSDPSIFVAIWQHEHTSARVPGRPGVCQY